MKKVMFYCQHVLGMGHFIRSMALVRGLQDVFHVCFLNGGEMVPGFEFPKGIEVVNLPPLRSDADFKGLESVDGQALDAIKQARTERILAEYERFRPDVVVIELFPFGRKKFAFELVPLLARIRLAGRRTKVVCSLRDILVGRTDQERYETRVCELLNRYFDAVLVHADPQLQRLEETFGQANDLQVPVHYTGYVVQASSPPEPETQTADNDRMVANEGTADNGGTAANDTPLIIASIGGGRVGDELLEATIAASTILNRTLRHRLLIFGGPYLPDERFAQLQTLAADRPHITLQHYTTRFLSYLQRANLSISMAGYNTCMDVVTTGVPALVLPFTGGDNDEQTIRAHKLEALGIVGVLQAADLRPEKLAVKMAERLLIPPTPASLNVDGARQTAALLKQLLQGGRVETGEWRLEIGDWPALSSVEGEIEGLRVILERLQDEGKPINIFLRDDDVDKDEETLRQLLDICLSRQVPLNAEVIPGRLTKAAVHLLKEFKKFHLDLLELNQHGWQHLNHEAAGRKCEFGPSRTFAQQVEDIRCGKALLEEAFGDRFYPVFTPPWNRCTADTFAALEQLGFKVLSRDRNTAAASEYHLREIPITLDIFRWKGGVTLKPAAAVVAELAQQLGTVEPIGIMLHHKVMDEQAFALLDQMLAVLRPYANVRFHTFQSLYEMGDAVPSGVKTAALVDYVP